MEARKVIFCLIVTLALYRILMAKHKYPHSYQLVLENMEVKRAWEFMSEFSNMKKINPTMLDYRILSDSGTRAPDGSRDWSYKVFYTEHLTYLPFLTNGAQATVRMITEGQGPANPYSIISEHETCMLGTCLNTTHSMEFRQVSTSTVITAHAEYECQLLLSYYCKLEYISQRALIHDGLYSTLASLSSE